MLATKDELAIKPIINNDLTIDNYNDLIQSVNRIKEHYSGLYVNDKEARAIRRKLNGLKRNLNNLRKAKAKPARAQLKSFKAQIDYLINGINQAEKPFKDQLKKAHDDKLKSKQRELQIKMNELCNKYGINHISVPMTDVRKRLSKADRLAVMLKIVHQQARINHLKNSVIVGNKVVDGNGEIIGRASKITVIGNETDVDKLKELAKKNGILVK